MPRQPLARRWAQARRRRYRLENLDPEPSDEEEPDRSEADPTGTDEPED